jgi:hypothetical protein
VLRCGMLGTSMFAAASLEGRAIGLAIATAVNSIVAIVVSCMVMMVGLGLAIESFERCDGWRLRSIVETGR